MLTAALLATVLAPPITLNVLFLGNSHTAMNDVPGMVRQLVQSDGSGRKFSSKLYTAAFVEELARNGDLRRDIESRNFNVIVIQGAKLSNSHRYEYDHSGAVEIAKLSKKHGLATWLFAEWPRRGWTETDYILKEYREISTPSGARIIPICRAWDRLISTGFKGDLWQADGNHASLLGSFLAACTIASHVAPNPPRPPAWKPAAIDSDVDAKFKRIAREIASDPT